jgi:fatty acid desaturase
MSTVNGLLITSATLTLLAYTLDWMAHRPPRVKPEDAFDVRLNRVRFNILAQFKMSRLDDISGPLLCTAVFSQLLVLAALLSIVKPSWHVFAIATIAASTRIRALQELTHFAVHSALTRNALAGTIWAQWAFQLPFLRPPVDARAEYHVRQHHPHVNKPERDPNLQEYISLGFVPPLSGWHIVYLLFYPLSLSGVAATLRNLWASSALLPRQRTVAILATVLCLYLAGGTTAVACCYVLPLLTFYPLLAWWSQLVEHRWFTREGSSSRSREYAHGRVIDIHPAVRWLLEAVFLPFGDSLHLAHSLYPGIRWTYLPYIHRIHLACDSDYRSVCVGGVLFASPGRRALLDDVMDCFERDTWKDQ